MAALAKDEPKLRARALEQMPPELFTRLLSGWGADLPAGHFVSPAHWRALLESPARRRLESSDVVALVAAALESDGAGSLSLLARELFALGSREAKAVRKLVRREKALPADFRRSLEMASVIASKE